MQSTRQEKISRLLQKEFGDIFVHYGRQIQGVIISVSEVRITSDLSISRIYLSIFPTEKAAELIDRINADKSSIRYELGCRLRNQLRIIPELNFYLDESIDKLANIDKILGADPYLHIPFDDEDEAED
ncbi:MAG: 30S ribosome-binding factor RbfA [Candidatus Aphodosoma sp.]